MRISIIVLRTDSSLSHLLVSLMSADSVPLLTQLGWLNLFVSAPRKSVVWVPLERV